jgi:hypothetical protein
MDREMITDALRFWELGRIPYNLVLLTIAVATVGPATFTLLPVNALGVFIVLAVVANVLYCVAYPIDIFMQMSAWREGWRAARFGLWLVGMLTAAWLTFNVCLSLVGVE